MNSTTSQLYNFAFRGLLAEEALDSVGRRGKLFLKMADDEIIKALALESLDEIHVANAKTMAIVYTAIAAFESGVRELVVKILTDKHADEWWEKGFSKNRSAPFASAASRARPKPEIMMILREGYFFLR